MRSKSQRNRNAAAAVSATAIALLGAYPLSNIQASEKGDASKAEERAKEKANDAAERAREKAKKDHEHENENDDDGDDHVVTTVAPTTLVPTTVVATTQPPAPTTQPPATTTLPPATTTTLAPVTTTTQPPATTTTTQPPATTTTQPPATTTTTTTTVAPPAPAVKASQQFVSMTVGSPIKMDTVVSNSGTAAANVSVVITLSSSGALPHFLEAKGTVGTWTCSAYIEIPVPPVSYTCTGTLAAGTSGTVTVSSGSKISGPVGTEVFAGVVVNPGGSANGTSAKYV
jgi:hypothetical protein